MRLGTIRTPRGPRAAVIRDSEAIVLDDYADVAAVFGAARGAEDLRAAAERAGIPYDPSELLRPVLAPGAIVCVGLNYRAHILEMGRELPEHPTLFSKFARALTDPYADVSLPAASTQVDYEGELAVVIGTSGRDIPRDRAWEHVGGLTIMNDVSMRDFQRRSLQWLAGKTFEACTPLGPWVVTPDEIADLGSCVLTVHVNGEERQRAPIGDLLFDVPALVSDLSQIVALQPGDIISTGTPGGVGEPSGRFLEDGDVVDVAIDGIGAIRNTFRR